MGGYHSQKKVLALDSAVTGKSVTTIILHSGNYDRVSYALSIALISLSMDKETHILATYDGLLRMVRGRLNTLDNTSPEVKAAVERGLKTGGLVPLSEQLANAKKLGLKLYACPSAMATLNITTKDLIPEVDGITGLAAFLELASTAEVNYYI